MRDWAKNFHSIKGGRRVRSLRRADVLLGLAAFLAVFALGMAYFFGFETLAGSGPLWILVAIVAMIVILETKLWRIGRPHGANRGEQRAPGRAPGVAKPGAGIELREPHVVDGDTVIDRSTRITYRLANIDAPETGDRARCNTERRYGEWAKWEAVRFVKGARGVEAVETGKTDIYGRIVAHIRVDGFDLGEILIRRGLARPWAGKREDWCGPQGALLQMAQSAGLPLHCGACRCGHARPSERA